MKPPGCKNNSGGGGGGGGGSGGGSSSSSVSSASGGGGGGDAQYAVYDSDGNYVENSAYDFNSDYSENEISDGATQIGSNSEIQRRANYFWYLVGGAAVASMVGVFLIKKKVSIVFAVDKNRL